MTKSSFWFVLSQIEGHPVFRNASPHSQAAVTLQLAVALDRLGNYGNGVSLGRTLILWGIGKGTCVAYTTRVLEALNDLSSTFVVWPNKRKRRAMSRRMASQGFKGCVGFIDGTTFPLSQKPAVDGECYFDRKSRYSINGQVVCDDNRRIIAFYGVLEDLRTQARCSLLREPLQDSKKHLFFSRGEYLIGRWASLKELRIQLNKKEDMERILCWITACVVHHNMLLGQNDNWTSDDESSAEDSDGPEEEESETESEDESDDDEFVFRRHLKKKAI
ncbi:Hypothetical protein PHPALM_1203 [Phytophthora palmivora]|uniref:DDE Tnp4 domain-containing protein n=1 Tax=Phytophthora palmivora TaxID=4796 RepID=A0A2P4YSW8_9STRA|nr:Hypothetical protein PHPALM_1203 [Phytophthora palmivora]